MIETLCALPLVSALLSACLPPLPLATGYVVGEYVLVAPVTTARIESLNVAVGERVAAGQVLATIESEDAEIAVASAEAEVHRAEAQLADLQEGSRPEEIAALEAAVASARAKRESSAREADRQERLREQGVISAAQLDSAHSAADIAAAALAEAEARLESARLPAREQQIAAASASVAVAEASLAASRWQLAQRVLHATAAGTIADVLRRAGEVASPSAPVVSLLPDGAVRLRLFVPEADFPALSVGTSLAVTCDGCEALTAHVVWIADHAEFTPPVIFSQDARQKLVFMVEAVPDDPAVLKPGQIVDVDLAP